MRLSKRHLLGICLSLLFIDCAAQDTSVTENSINIGTHRLHFYSKGSGSPTIVLDAGMGNSYRDWLPLFEKVSQKIQIFCYDRAGYGQSEMGPLPRTCDKAADELQKLLDNANIKGPYLLVGHSLGALNLQIFAHKNMKNIEGMLLLDPPPLDWISGKGFPELTRMAEKQTRVFEETAKSMRNSDNNEQKKQTNFFLTLASEHGEMFLSSSRQVAAITSFKDIPVIVIASGKPNPAFGDDAVPFQKFWNEQCKQLAAKSSNSKYLLAAESGHHIHIDNSEIVLKAINELLSEGNK
jgi:pimeloyl-ACP methyl ester carboxylesterase